MTAQAFCLLIWTLDKRILNFWLVDTRILSFCITIHNFKLPENSLIKYYIRHISAEYEKKYILS